MCHLTETNKSIRLGITHRDIIRRPNSLVQRADFTWAKSLSNELTQETEMIFSIPWSALETSQRVKRKPQGESRIKNGV